MDVAQVISQRSLCDLYFSPRRVAVVGASNDPRKLSGRVIDFLNPSAFTGEIIPINPRRDTVQALRAYPSVDAYPHGAIDLAVLAVPAADVPSALEECAAADIRAAIVSASGFAEPTAARTCRNRSPPSVTEPASGSWGPTASA